MTKTLLEDIKAYALAHYEEGFDVIVECFSDEELEEYIADNEVTTVEEFAKSYAPVIDYHDEIKATAF